MQGSKLVKDLQQPDFEPMLVQQAKAFNEVLIQPIQKQLDDLLKTDGVILRQNRHAERDPNVTLKFKDGGSQFLEDLELEGEEEKQ